MSKIATIARSEYVRRVTSKGFILATVLAPLFLIGLMGTGVVVGVLTAEGGAKNVAILDETGRLGPALAQALPESYTAALADVPEDSLRAQVRRGELDGYFVLPAALLAGGGGAAYYSAGGGGLTVQLQLREAVTEVVRQARLEAVGASDAVRGVLEERVGVQMVALTDEGEAADAAFLYSAVGYVMGFVIYIAVLIYGSIVMRGVIEEKANRIVEVIASSAKPFELMMGKVLGIGAVGLTQFVLWAALLGAALAAAVPLLSAFVDAPAMADVAAQAAAQEEVMELAGLRDLRLPPVSLFVYFVLFFLGGYLLYASLFAAVGSAVESESDAQSLQAPIMIPVILPAVFLPFIADNPDAPLSVVLSLVPLFSPILMPVRAAATAVPFWQMAASLLLLAAGFVATIWVAARIYRVGILMYGKKASFRDLARWVRTA